MRWNHYVVAAFLGLSLWPAMGQAQITVSANKPGDIGTLRLPLRNESDSPNSLRDVSVSVVGPAHFLIQSDSILYAAEIPPGQTTAFVVRYQISPTAPEGAFDVLLRVNIPDQIVYPPQASMDTVVHFGDSPSYAGASQNTLAGDNRVVSLSGQLEVEYTYVAAAGQTDVDLGAPGFALPEDFSSYAGAPAFNLTTTASYEGPVVLSLDYSDEGLNPAQEKNLRLLHMAPGGTPRDATYSLDTASNRITAAVYSAGSFALVAKDWVPPNPVGDLRASPISSRDVALAWSAPGDDGDQGKASSYDIRFATFPLTEENFDVASSTQPPLTPENAGTVQEMFVAELGPETLYYFAVKAKDNLGNVSAVSNVAVATTPSANLPSSGKEESAGTEGPGWTRPFSA